MSNQNKPKPWRITLPTLSTLLVFCLILTACGTPSTAATESPLTEAPTEEASVSIELPVADCDTLLPPEDCNPDWIGGVNYTPLAQLPTGECEIRLLDQGVGQCSLVTYTDVNGQVFTITVEGADAAAVQEYLQDVAAYFVVQQVDSGVKPPTELKYPSLPTILVETTAEKTGLSQEELRGIRDSLIAEREGDETFVTLAEVILTVPSDPEQILKAAIERAVPEFTTAGEAAGLTPEEIDGLLGTLPEELNAWMYAPGAWVLLDSATIPQDDAGYGGILTNNPAALAITLDWASAPKQESTDLWLVWFSIDPKIDANAYHYYKEQCNTQSASVRISATAGRMTNYFWRRYPYYYNVGNRTADVGSSPSPNGMTHSSYPNRRSYDTYVKGGAGGGTYYIYGGWVQGSGCQ